MDSTATATRQRGIPRFSKLPQPGRPAEVRPITPVEAPSAIGRPGGQAAAGAPRSTRAPTAAPPLARSASTASRPPSSYSRPPSSYGAIRPPSSYGQNGVATPRRQPLSSARPQSKQGLYSSRDNTLTLSTQDTGRGFRQNSQEENELQYESPSPVSESWSSPSTPHDAPTSPSASSRKSRPSLSDRTIESLSQTPTASARRRSSFFGGGQPTATPSRPPSALAQASTTANRQSSYGSVRSAMPRPASPTKRPQSSYGASSIAAPPSARRLSTALPRPGGPGNALPTPKVTSPTKLASPTKTTARPAAATPHSRSRSTAEPRSAMPTPRSTKPTRAPAASVDLTKSRTMPVKASAKKSTAAPPSAAGQAQAVSDEAAPVAKSSSSFRNQISKAKAERRAALTRSVSISADASSSAYNLEDMSDPFGQKRDDGKGELRKRLDDARRDGRLNIAAMGTKCIPAEVMQMYDAEAVQAGSVPWNECVDLVRFLAGDNDIETIGDDIFPDMSMEELYSSGGSNQFGGIETLDLRGNVLVNLPMGLRRLERLTSINLCRNKLENWCMEVLSQIPTLRELNLSDNALSLELPSSIGNLDALESLDVHGNKLTGLPSSIRNLKALRSLNVGNNRISDLNMDILTMLPLTELYASSNALTGALFPMNVTQMPRLQVLSIANNSIASLSFLPTLSFPSLRRLDVSCNRMFMLPDMSTWQCLNSLLCEENSLEAFPQGFASLSSLRNASFEHNNIREIIDGIQHMDSLEMLSLGGNPIRPTKYMTMSTEQLKMDLARKFASAEEASEAVQPQDADVPEGNHDSSGIGETF